MRLNLDNTVAIGHDMQQEDENHIRVCITNPNSISMQNHEEQFQELCDNASLHEIDYLGCPEIKLDTTQQEISSSPMPAKYFYKPGGTMCLAQGNINSRKVDQGCNQYGHWSYMKNSAAGNRINPIITA
eukprot:11135651-Ditylum_brightwellii.AAC.1